MAFGRIGAIFYKNDGNDDFKGICPIFTRIDLKAQKELESGQYVKRRENISMFRKNQNISHCDGFRPFSKQIRDWTFQDFENIRIQPIFRYRVRFPLKNGSGVVKSSKKSFFRKI